MSFSLVLPTTAVFDWKPINLAINFKSIFRSRSAKVAAEALSLLSVTVGLFTLFLGLSVL
ncbi:hypothetical protein COX59_03505 [Candidatus Beckwithbacteria bacterium CG_4_10_14_0_2_um_filter_47_25]|uniref:Uncharacterized protein n=4 Tax=Candidatus Beckwithiibacteriota TaxID=1752726 RepID=A0A1J4RRC8_9BACT|nr:MAG: hypothetical protein AUJ59_00425 [Candidatus Beckwithbacteria bacterium CG1_02_47_37]PIP52445.1 MAG: hypothetical protein COX09_01525 [Candidatus Beckwithbacteria bacterium CG23_combo_of_CG06-09_8_20_14_all_47_9]PJA22018.1 MAG: hypothetical protein COX59_03505 [Candidatus Beckwithbacteria bacterium CG_4_10_14_0_2_um_filter_47_25]PJC66720.1 MAG: hypothetical protein CO018_00455 [Candidatus Beckwithbacteria bacterium CG_4_9_14_0_2_um_filter_47_11]